jgi:trehalose 6-phosphate phosphatase
MTADSLAPLRKAPRQSALILDVDGTLAPIVLEPQLARVPEATRTELGRLSGRYLLVACLSGRTSEDASRVVGVEGVRYVGNHGLELDSRAQEFVAPLRAFRDAVGRQVEDKGLTLSYHFRAAADEAAARADLEAVAERARAAGLVPRWGRKVLEIRPPLDADKGTAVRSLLTESGARRALYAGDDTTDLDAFAGLREAALDYSLCVAVASGEAPAELVAAADLVVRGPEDLARLFVSL